jgi:endonuclease YncB( thermonuclease family)
MRYFFFILIFCVLTACGNIYVVTEVPAVNRIRIQGGEEFRYLGVKAPEEENYYYPKSMEFHRDLVLGKKVRIEKDAGLTEGVYVFIKHPEDSSKELFVNAELLLRGRAWFDLQDKDKQTKSFKPDYLDKMAHAEQTAQESGLGVWERKP